MKRIAYHEPHKESEGKFLEEIILGGQDGVVNILGSVMGVAIATADSRIILIAGIASAFAESVSMMAVGYTSSKAADEYVESARKKEIREIEEVPEIEKKEIREIFEKKGIRGKQLEQIVGIISSNKKAWLDIMMTEELNLPSRGYKDPKKTALVIGGSALVGSFVPLLPFFFLPVQTGIVYSIAISTIALFATGAAKGKITTIDWKKSGAELAIVGMSAAAIGYIIGLVLGATI